MKQKYLLSLAVLGSFLLGQSAMAAQAVLNWNANSESDLAGYKVYYGTSARTTTCPTGGGYASSVDVGNVTTYTLDNLTGGTNYYFAVTAYDTSDNESCYSTEASKLILDDNTIPYITIGNTTTSLQTKTTFKKKSKTVTVNGKKKDMAGGKVMIYLVNGRKLKKVKTRIIDTAGYWASSLTVKAFKKSYKYRYVYYNSAGQKIYTISKKLTVKKA